MQDRGMKKNGFWKVSLTLVWKTQWEDMVLDVQKQKETDVFCRGRSKRNENNKWESCL